MIDLIYMAAAFLLPLVVAVVVFYFMAAGKGNSSADIEGTLYGLKMKAGGVLAGYVIVLLIAISFTNKRLKEREEANAAALKSKQSENMELQTANNQLRVQKETWRVRGRVKLAGAAPQSYEVAVIPPRPNLDSHGKFDFNLRIPSKTDEAGPRHIPEIVISRDGYEPVSFPLDPDARITAGYSKINYTVSFDKDLREIRIDPPIALEPALKEDYRPTEKLPEPLSSPLPGN